MQILHHPDIAVLESALVDLLDADRRAAPGVRRIVLVPNTRLADHVQRRLLDRRPAWLGVEVRHFAAMAREILARTGAPARRPLTPPLIEALVEEALTGTPDGTWSRFVAARPGALPRIARALQDLREAGVEPADVAALARDAGERHLADLLRSLRTALERLEADGWRDEVGTLRDAAARVGDAGLGGVSIRVHGAYEFVGSALDLLRALDRVADVTLLLPFAAGARATRYAEAYARRHLIEPPASVTPLADDGSRSRLPLTALYDEDVPVAPQPDRFRFRHLQGVEAEARWAIRRALAAVAEGVEPARIAILGRDLSDHAAILEEGLEADGAPWQGTLRASLRRHPLVHDFLLALRAVDDGLPRRAASELLASAWLDWSWASPAADAPVGRHAEPWSRAARILGGLDEWRQALPRWAERPVLHDEMTDEERAEAVSRATRRGDEARAMTGMLSRVHERVAPDRERTWDRFADDLVELLRAVFLEPASDDRRGVEARVALLAVLETMRALAQSGIDPRPVSLARCRAWLERAVDAGAPTSGARDEGGIHVLDLLQARGLTFDRVIWVGLESGRFPRPPREDPVLVDRLREGLRERTGRPLAVRGEAADEERMLLALTLGAARGPLDVSWQRADDDGRARTPSLALRELARLATGAPEIERLTGPDAHRVPSHPERWLEALATDTGMLSDDEALLLAALRAGEAGPRAVAALREALGPGIDLLGRTESFEPSGSEYDGRIGATPDEPRRDHSVTALETLGRCPLQYLFRFVLRVREPDEEVAAWSATPREVGVRIHALLERLYRAIADEGVLDEPDAAARARRVTGLLREAWAGGAGPLDARLRDRLPVLWAQQQAAWGGALERFVEEDLARLVESGLRPIEFEESLATSLELGEGVRARVRGRIDRRLREGAEEWVGDYKTSGNLATRANPTEMLKGRALQVPLYHLLAGGHARVELLGVGPAFDPGAVDADPKARHARFEGFRDDRERSGLLETLRVLLDLVERGRFPLNPDSGRCDYCAYLAACRRNHPPTVHRESHSADVRDYYRLGAKNRQRSPLLADLPVPDGEEAEG